MKQRVYRCYGCIAFFLFTVVLALNFGSTELNLYSLLKDFENFGSNSESWTIFFNLRVPRVLVAVLCGASLGAGGVLSQGLFRNSLASPSILGTTAGGASFASLAFVLGASAFGSWVFPVAAFSGCLAATLIILLLSRRTGINGIENLLLCGLAVSTLFSAFTSLSVSLALADYIRFPVIMHWLLGSIDARDWIEISIAFVTLSFSFFFAYRLSKVLDVLVLGDEVAQSLSVNVSVFRIKAITMIAVFESISLSLAGGITFVGLIVPHITRNILGPQHGRLIFFSGINGATLVVLSDLLARTLTAPAELQVGVITSVVGAVFFLFLLLRRNREIGPES